VDASRTIGTHVVIVPRINRFHASRSAVYQIDRLEAGLGRIEGGYHCDKPKRPASAFVSSSSRSNIAPIPWPGNDPRMTALITAMACDGQCPYPAVASSYAGNDCFSRVQDQHRDVQGCAL